MLALSLAVLLGRGPAIADNIDDGTEQIPVENQRKILVAYFSASGNTARVAKFAAKAIGADLYEIAPEQPYSQADLDYRNPKSRSSLEHADSNRIPKIKGDVKDWNSYSAVLIGYPVWWGEAPNIVKGFVKKHDFSNKAVVPFCTSGGGGMGDSGKHLQGLASKAVWLHGDCFAPSIDEESVAAWAVGLLTGDGPRG